MPPVYVKISIELPANESISSAQVIEHVLLPRTKSPLLSLLPTFPCCDGLYAAVPSPCGAAELSANAAEGGKLFLGPPAFKVICLISYSDRQSRSSM